jgi:glycerol uptake facilitator-like aquaporin
MKLRILAAEAIGTALLVATVVGSGIMAQRLSQGNDAVALLGNTAATGAVLYVLISLLGPISGAQFNPAVTLLLGSKAPRTLIILTQIAAGVAGAALAHGMFDMDLIQQGMKIRTGTGQWLGEIVASFGLLLTIRLAIRHRPESIPALVAGWIIAGYWFTSSTSFANPAVTIARAFSDSFAGIRLVDTLGFIAAQFVGATLGHYTAGWLIKEDVS